MWEEEIDHRRREAKERIVGRDRVSIKINHAENSTIDGRVLHAVKSLRNLFMTSFTVRILPIPVVIFLVPVKRNTYTDAFRLDCIQCLLIQERAIGLHPLINTDACINGIADLMSASIIKLTPPRRGSPPWKIIRTVSRL